MRLKIDVTPPWWRVEAKSSETFAVWCVRAMRLILAVWPTAEVRISRERVSAVVAFEGDVLVLRVDADKMELRRALATCSLYDGSTDHCSFVDPRLAGGAT